MELYMIRHGMTKGNLERRYIGRTDEDICEEGRQALGRLSLAQCEIIAASPMKRCIETARILWPGKEPIVCSDFRECDFGDFEGKNYEDLNGREDYQRWIDSFGALPFPGGEDPARFRERCIRAFEELMEICSGCESLGLAVHGGTVMALMERFAEPRKGYYDWQVPCAGGFHCRIGGGTFTVLEKI